MPPFRRVTLTATGGGENDTTSPPCSTAALPTKRSKHRRDARTSKGGAGGAAGNGNYEWVQSTLSCERRLITARYARDAGRVLSAHYVCTFDLKLQYYFRLILPLLGVATGAHGGAASARHTTNFCDPQTHPYLCPIPSGHRTPTYFYFFCRPPLMIPLTCRP